MLERTRQESAQVSAAASCLQVTRYTANDKTEWDNFVDAGKNATFMFRRDYMDYHAHQFEDHSLMVRRGGRLAAVLPANRRDEFTVVSHQGLTYGGFVLTRDATLKGAIETVHASLAYLDANAVRTLVYRRLPRFYNTLPDDEIDYALFLVDATLTRRDCSLTLCSWERLPIRSDKRNKINKGSRAGLSVVEESSFEPFWNSVLQPRLAERFAVKPVHSLDEISRLAELLPQNIKQYSVYFGNTIVAGITIYETPTVAHMQYSAVTAEGEALGALDFLVQWLIFERYENKRYFDFGICNEREGRSLNHGLLQSKEGFGARTMAHDFYSIDTGAYPKLQAVLTTRSDKG